MAAVVVLKKYANRRIYDTEKSVYITLNEVADYIRAGEKSESRMQLQKRM
jgi:polyhydroxyalkanoate synthesis regulator protein